MFHHQPYGKVPNNMGARRRELDITHLTAVAMARLIQDNHPAGPAEDREIVDRAIAMAEYAYTQIQKRV